MKPMFKQIKRITYFLLTLTFLACVPSTNEDIVCDSGIIGVGTTGVEGPTEATVNQNITFNVSFSIDNNCGSFQLFNEEVVNATEKIVTVNVRYEGCECNNVPVISVQPYTFTATAPGVYTLKFRVTNTTFVTKTITVS